MKKNRSWAILVLLVLFTASAAAAMVYGRIGYRFAADGSAVLLFLAIAEGLLDKRQDALADLSPWRYSCSHTAQLREVEILSPSRFRNSLAGTFSGSI